MIHVMFHVLIYSSESIKYIRHTGFFHFYLRILEMPTSCYGDPFWSSSAVIQLTYTHTQSVLEAKLIPSKHVPVSQIVYDYSNRLPSREPCVKRLEHHARTFFRQPSTGTFDLWVTANCTRKWTVPALTCQAT